MFFFLESSNQKQNNLDTNNTSLFIMSWQNYILSVIGSSVLMFGCWGVGHFAFSFLWIIFFVILYVLKSHMWICREQKRTRLRNIILCEQDAVIAQFGGRLDELPAWVQFPDIERLEWVNKVVVILLRNF